MNVAFDIDGIMTDLVGFQLKYGKKYFNNKDIVIDESKLKFSDMFNCSEEEEEKFWKKYIWRYCLKEKARNGISELTRKLKEDGANIYIFTGRAHTTEDGKVGELFRKMVKYWLKKENIKYDYMYYCLEEESANKKAELCMQHNIDIYFEDQTKNINSISTVTTVITLDEKHNVDCNEKNVFKISNIEDAYNIIKSNSYTNQRCKK